MARALGRLFAFRFALLYVAAYALFNGNTATLPLALVAHEGAVPAWYTNATNAVWSAVGRAIGIHGDVRAFDNGDGVGDHVALLCFAGIALVGSGIWTFRERQQRPIERDVFRVGLRAVLGMTVFAYAVFKVFPAQFSTPSPSRLVETFGSTTRMGLMWTFFGASPVYQILAGLAELAGCLLLLTRRTTPLGAVVLLAVLTNVFVMDVCYDVPAKLCVLHLLAMALGLIAPSAARLFDVLVRNRAVRADELGPPASRGRVVATLAFVLLVVAATGVPAGRFYYTQRDGAPLPPLYGVYEIVELRRNGVVVPPLLTDAAYLHLLAVDRRGGKAFCADGSRIGLTRGADADGHAVLRNERAALSLEADDDGALAIRGTYDGLPIAARARRLDLSSATQFPLNRPLHWFYDGR
jgi:uncharacterized membrane protein YphA (DoxX/SURF4 family)